MTQALNIAQLIASKAQVKAPTPVDAPTSKPTKSNDLNWETMDLDTLPNEMQTMFRSIVAAQEVERQAKAKLQDALAELLDLPSHLTVRVGSKWGRLSVALDRKTGKGGVTLADLIAKINASTKG